MASDDSVMRALAAHDETVERFGVAIWIGAEPTYTDRWSESPQWLFAALGDDKRQRAEQMVGRTARTIDGAAILRSVGRPYAGEPTPRWSYGLYRRRDGKPLWRGPLDPLLSPPDSRPDSPPDVAAMADALAAALQSMGMSATALDDPLRGRVVFRCDDTAPPTRIEEEPMLARESIHEQTVEGAEVVDALADTGTWLVSCDVKENVLWVELPSVRNVVLFEQLLHAISRAATEIAAPALILAGYPPPVDDTVAWMTITADPAVIEVNMAPANRATDLLRSLRNLQAAAAEEGLESFRLQYNGEESDSGGGGQITLGGPSPEESPFLTVPSLLPSLVRYFNRHPSLSYLHAFESVGPGSQAPRADEAGRGRLAELNLALELLRRIECPLPETLWGSLAPFLADSSGNSHRAEINIEKLWNPYLGARGRQGLVEFRSFRMGPSAETTASLAALLRAVVAMLARHPCDQPLIDWGQELHQRFSLPLYLHRDLREVLADLERVGLGLEEPLVNHLVRDRDLLLSNCDLGGTRIELRRALEFWPLVGDAAAQEQGGSRLIDASTSRIEIRLRCADQTEVFKDWSMKVGNWAIPMAETEDEIGPVRLTALRYRRFAPQHGLHPTLPAQTPVQMVLSHPREGSWQITVHEWDPDGNPYPGLPKTVAEARERRAARCVLKRLEEFTEQGTQPCDQAVGPHVIDLRWQ